MSNSGRTLALLCVLQVVHSRTFGNAAREGGVGVRMLVPLVDMLNHAGDETSGLLTLPPVPKDNVRWDRAALLCTVWRKLGVHGIWYLHTDDTVMQ